MTFQAYFVLLVFVLTIVGLIKFQQRPALVFGSTLITLFAADLVSSDEVLSSLSNQGLITLVLLLTCSLALEKTRLLRMIATKVIDKKYSVTWLRLFSFTALSSALLNNTAIVSTMLAPIRSNPYHPPGKLLIPLSYAAILGGTLTLVGTSTNLIVNSMVLETGLPSLNFFDFTVVGIGVVLTSGLVLWYCSRFLPAHGMDKQEDKSYFIDAKVSETSSLIGKSIEENGLRHLESLFLVEIVRSNHLIRSVSPSELIQAGDRLVFSGDVTKVKQINQFDGLDIFADHQGLLLDNLNEVIIRPGSMLVGKTLKKSGFRALFDAAVVAIKRDGGNVSGKLGEVKLKVGDYLVLAIGEDFKSRRNISKNFILASDLELDSMLSGKRALLSVAGFFIAIAGAAFGLFSLFKGMFLLLAVLLLSRCLTSGEVLRRLPFEIWLIISSALVLSQSLVNSGVVAQFSEFVNQYSMGLSPIYALIVMYLLTWWLTELVTNNAAAALIFPIAFGLANALGANPMAFIMAVAFGASASFVSPYGYQTNLMVYNAGQYRLMDFVKVGLPVSFIYSMTAITMIVLVFGL